MKTITFSQKVKKELLYRDNASRHCDIAELTAVLSCSCKFSDGCIKMHTDSIYAAQKFKRLVKKLFGSDCRIDIKKRGNLLKHSVFELYVNDIQTVAKITKKTDVNKNRLSALNVSAECCGRAFLRGLFLCCGSITEPKNSNHLELMINEPNFCEDVMTMIKNLDLELVPRTAERKGRMSIYFKDGAQICDFLSLTGAYKAMMEYENSRIIKDYNNSINRRVNFINANMDKSMSASMMQMNDILLIEKNVGITSLPDSLEKIAKLRLANPEASLVEIGEMLNPPVGKSGVSHRLRKISKIADEIAVGLNNKDEK